MKRLRMAVVGLDHYHVTGWVESFAQLQDAVEIAALYDPSPILGQTLAPAYRDPTLSPSLSDQYRNCPFYTDLDRLIREQKPDIALVTLPNVLAPAAIEALAGHGVHMLVDKPGARTADEARRAFGAARAAGVKVAVGLTKRYAPMWQDVRDLMQAGRLGRLLCAEAIFVTSSVKVRGTGNPLFSRTTSGGGVLHWLGIHDLDALLWLSGDRVVEVQAVTAHVSGEAIDVEEAVSLSLRFASGAFGTVYYAYALPRPGSDGYLALRGSRGSVKVTSDGELIWVGAGTAEDPAATKRTTYDIPAAPGYGTIGLTIISNWLRAIEDDTDPIATGQDIVRALELVDAAYESARSGRPVRLSE